MTRPGARITLHGENGSSYDCLLLDIVEFDSRYYAIMTRADAEQESFEDTRDASIVIMRLIPCGEQSIFEIIAGDQEFERVVAHVRGLARLS